VYFGHSLLPVAVLPRPSVGYYFPATAARVNPIRSPKPQKRRDQSRFPFEGCGGLVRIVTHTAPSLALAFGAPMTALHHVGPETVGASRVTQKCGLLPPTAPCRKFSCMRIALIHAMSPSIPPIVEAFSRLWPEATLMNLLDDSLARDLARDGSLTAAMTERFLTLARYARATGSDAILFTCSAFGPCIEACARELPAIPVLKPNEAMIEEAISLTGPRGRIGLMATFAPTLSSMPPAFSAVAPQATLVPCLAEGALAALNAGDRAGHDAAAVRAATALLDCDVIALAQFSLSPAAAAIAAATGKTVLTTPDSAVQKLRHLLLTAKAA
jgi:hypothetical protein